MVANIELIKKVREHFSLNIYETKVWVALLGKGIATAGEIAEISSVPRSRTYDVLESLEKRGFAIEKLGKPVKYIAVKPSVVLEKLKSNVIQDAEEKADVLSNLKETEDYKQIELLHKQGIQPIQIEDLSGTIKGRANIYSHLKEMVSKASNEIIIATNTSALRKKAKILNPLLSTFQRKGVKLRIFVNGTEDEIKELSKEIKADIKQTKMDARFTIVDGKELLFMLNNEPRTNEDNGIWITSPYFASALSSMFDLSWKN